MDLIDVLIQSKEIKKLLVDRSFKYRIPLDFICREVGISYTDFMRGYINSKDGKFFEISESKFREILSILGIHIRSTVVIDKSLDMIAVSKSLSDKYDSIAEEKRKERRAKNYEEEGNTSDVE